MTKEKAYIKLVEILGVFADIFKRELSEITYRSYYEALKDLPIETIQRNAEIHLKTSKFFPVPADLRGNVQQKDFALLAWESVLKAIQKHGYYDSVTFQDKIINSVISAMGGWLEISSCNLDDFKRRTFCDYYIAFQNKQNHVEQLDGFHNTNNSFKNHSEHLKKPNEIICGYLTGQETKLLKE